MFKLLANAAFIASLMVGASAATPAWSADKHSGAKCPYAKHKQAKRAAPAKAQPARGVTLVEHRKMDVQILSFGP